MKDLDSLDAQKFTPIKITDRTEEMDGDTKEILEEATVDANKVSERATVEWRLCRDCSQWLRCGNNFGTCMVALDLANKSESHDVLNTQGNTLCVFPLLYTPNTSKHLENYEEVNHPQHYTTGDVECIDAIKAALGTEGFVSFCHGNAMKYLWRWKHKGGVEDLKKCRWYLDKMIEVAR